MLVHLSLRDFVFVRTLDLEFEAGFTAVTGETGAGKSVLLAALGFALGGKGPHAPVRAGAETASVSAVFEVGARHPVRELLSASGVEIDPGEALAFRRTLRRGQGARGYVNDQPVGAKLLQAAADLLVDLHGQHESVGLAGAGRQRGLLDAFARAGAALKRTAAAADRCRLAIDRRLELETRAARAGADRDYLDHALAELDRLAPEADEASRLALDRAGLQAGERLGEAMDAAASALAKGAVDHAVGAAIRALARAMAMPNLAEAGALADRLREASEALDRAQMELGEAQSALNAARHATGGGGASLESVEARLFALRAAGRKHDVDPDRLADVRDRLAAERAAIDAGEATLAAARAEEAAAREDYRVAAANLSALRQEGALRLEAAVRRELAPLRLEAARFRVAFARRAEDDICATGVDEIAFEFAASPEAAFAPLGRTASGGEMARLSLAIGVCLAGAMPAATLAFDEADIGLGGAVAAAVGERLARLGKTRQVLAVTHSPQVAASAARQLRIAKSARGGRTETRAAHLAPSDRREEIARMLAGAQVTDEARAAADRLLAGA
jgi:DNA repair protein RecN (Recombination protein N)